ncbi:MAG TPA: EAL domain-containing protein [Usitatibacter sp.]|nr:EAL domain-containing protein [Usitatibacter sp.]
MGNSRRPRVAALLALACGLAASLFAWYHVGQQADREARAQFAGRANLAANLLERRLQRYLDILYGLQAFAYHEDVTRGEFRQYVNALQLGRRFPGVQAVEFVRRVPRAERDRFVQSLRADPLLAGVDAPIDIRPDGDRPEYWVVDYLEPLAGNESVLGLDILTRGPARAAAERARDANEPSATGRYRLAQETGVSYGLVIYLPVFANPARQELQGFVNVVLRVDSMLGDTLRTPLLSDLRMRIHEMGARGASLARPSADSLFYGKAEGMSEPPSPSIQSRHSLERPLEVAGRQWLVQINDEPALIAWLRPVPLAVLLLGFGTTLLLYSSFQAIARTRSEAVDLAQRATLDLTSQLAFTQKLEADTRDSNDRLRAVIEAAPLAIIARDLDGVIRMWNPAAERLFGWKESEVLETSTSIVPDHLTDAVRDMRLRAQKGETVWIEETQRRRRDGSLVDVSVSISPIYGDGRVMGTMVTIADISRRKQAEAALRESESQLRLAMEAAQMGMWYWEADTDRFTYSDGLNVLFGRPSESAAVDYRTLQQRLHPEDREHFAATLRHAIKGGSDFAVDYRVVWPDGSVHWVSNRGQVHRASDGRATRVIGVAMNITERKLAEQRVAHMAHHDALTGLPNRVLLRDRIQQAIAQGHRAGTQVAVLFLDLDRFKTINDSLGHQLGDRLLQSVASRILVCVREGDTVSRVGGDEFVIVVPGIASSSDGSAVAAKILEVLASAFHLHGNDLHVAASIGISLYPSDGLDAETLMRNADTAMYHAKDMGRGNFQFFTQHMNVAAQQRLMLDNSLRRALEMNEFELQYQPLFDLRDRSITGFEALLRWHPPGEAVVVGPSQFIAAAEESGLIVPLGEWVLGEAMRQAAQWQGSGRPLSLSVNVSAKQLARSSFVDLVRELLAETRMDPHLIELEITESVIIAGGGEAQEALHQLAALGVGLAIDDFGTGYSGLAYLKRLPIDTVKIDQSFVRDLTVDPEDAAIVTAIVAMARSLDVDVVAEGVETEEQLEELKRLGCFRAQGYLLAHPMTADAVARRLDRVLLVARGD